MLSSPTCVGLRYGHHWAMYDAFLGSMLGASMRSSGDSRYCRGSALTDKRICLLVQPTQLQRTSVCARTLRFCVTPYIIAFWWYGNIDPFSIAYAFRPRLRTRLTLFRLTLNRNPEAYGGQVSHLSYRYSCLHFLFQKLHSFSRSCFAVAGMLPYRFPWKPGASVPVLMPANFRCQIARPVSCYALFK